ncbi:MAG: RNA-binding protein [Kangiellaceae bacterium]|nr:RNA-binding protein [Kangiellaceae bacterium]
MKLLIRNLDRLTTEEEIKDLFQEIGAVQSCDLVMDKESGKSKGFGFIEMPKVSEAKAAIKKLNNTAVGSNRIRVKKAEDRSE